MIGFVTLFAVVGAANWFILPRVRSLITGEHRSFVALLIALVANAAFSEASIRVIDADVRSLRGDDLDAVQLAIFGFGLAVALVAILDHRSKAG